ncbi:putative UPF0160 protein C27H6.8 [Paratrimastix pyriformis]|uniref:UPF0160 protein C27H6.8 n=1 Tax=Paratrimastix pyriformis TaxID=342808 RepID=A0ABQ8UJ46_9EUKA|nr:putative UPF0160 protein C27H6.8 [Paratrimastix pyriformis]
MAEIVPSIVVHGGKFHCDDAMAVALLMFLPQYSHATVLRTFDAGQIAAATVVCDIGGVYDHSKLRYDHHQRGFNEVFSPKNQKIKMASAGLVWRHYGPEIMRTLAESPLNDQSVALLHFKVYQDLIAAVDANDNGIDQYSHVLPPGAEPLFAIHSDLSSRVASLNPNWQETCTPGEVDARFMQGVGLCREEFLRTFSHAVKSWLPARAIISKAIEERHLLAPDCGGRVLVLSQNAPWRDHLFTIEEERSISPSILYVVVEDAPRHQWSSVCVPLHRNTFLNRAPFPEAWRGLRDAELSARASIPGCAFVHASGFMAAHATKDGAMDMCRQAMKLAPPS